MVSLAFFFALTTAEPSFCGSWQSTKIIPQSLLYLWWQEHLATVYLMRYWLDFQVSCLAVVNYVQTWKTLHTGLISQGNEKKIPPKKSSAVPSYQSV